MMLLSILFLSVAFDLYYRHLIVKAKKLLVKGECWPQWKKLDDLRKSLTPWTGFLRFTTPIVILLIVEDMTGNTYSWPVWTAVVLWGLVSAYWELLAYFVWVYKAYFVKSNNPHHDTKWLLYVARNRLVREFGDQYPTTYAFFRLAARLLICNTIGHRWKNWEMVKYGNFGDSRMCKACLMNEHKEKGVSTFSETHTGRWVRIANPNSVFRRKHINTGF